MIEVNDTVRILMVEDEDDINAYARVTRVREDGLFEVTNLNMPFQGTLCRVLFTKHEIRKN